MKIFGPKKQGDPTIGGICPRCDQPFREGNYTTLISIGPGDNLEARKRCVSGRPYNCKAIEVHWTCATGLPENADIIDTYRRAGAAELN